MKVLSSRLYKSVEDTFLASVFCKQSVSWDFNSYMENAGNCGSAHQKTHHVSK